MKTLEPKDGKGTMQLLPAAPGTCTACAVAHDSNTAHNAQSLFYQMRFRMQHGRDATWADACAHLCTAGRARWKKQLVALGGKWTEPASGAEPICESVTISGEAGGERKLTVLFTCRCCTLQTPAIARIPTGTDLRRPLDLEASCHHCGKTMRKKYASVNALVREQPGGEA